MRSAVLLSLVFVLLVFSSCRPAAAPVTVSNSPVSINDRPTTNQPLPPSKPISEMAWTTLDEKVQKLGDMTGKAVILDFWATYCGPCREEIPHLNSLLAKHGSENLTIVGLNVGGKEDLAEIPDFIKTTKINYPIAVPEDELSRFVFENRTEIPQTAVFDRKGRLVTKMIGFGPRVQKELDAAVETALKAE